MDLNKKVDLLRKRNIELQEKLDKANAENDKAKILLNDLAVIKNEWESELSKLKKQRKKYNELIAEIKKVKETMLNGF